MITTEELQNVLEKAFPSSEVEVEDMAGDGNHYSLTIKSKDFNGLSLIEQHRLVYQRLGQLAYTIHALKIKTSPVL